MRDKGLSPKTEYRQLALFCVGCVFFASVGTVALAAADKRTDMVRVDNEKRRGVASFFIDRTEVTQVAYRRCVDAGVCRLAQPFSGCHGDNYPAVGVSWDDARTFCEWAGKRLPTEAEWERAASSGDGGLYPWGDELSCDRANYGNFGGAGPCAEANPGRINDVGHYPGGRSNAGAFDMSGNAWEWTAERVLKGGGCCSFFTLPTVSNRLVLPHGYVDRDIGFRCASSGPSNE